MSKPDAGELSAALRRIASQSAPTAADPAATVRQKADRLRTRRIASTAVMGAAAVALVVPVSIVLFPSDRQADLNAATTTTTTSPSTTPASTAPASTPKAKPSAVRGRDGVLETTIDLDKLPRGKVPQVPWYADGVIHDGDRRIPFRGDFEYINSLQKVSGGYVVLADYKGPSTGDAELFLVRSNGEKTSLDRETSGLIFDPAVSDDGNLIAWSRFRGQIHEGTGIDTKLNVYDIAAGRVTDTKEISGGEESLLEVRAFLGSKVVVNRATNAASKPVKIWDPRRGTLTDWHDSYSLAGITTDGSLAAVSTDGSKAEDGCFAVLGLPAKQQLWRSCRFNHNDVFFAPGNRYVASSNFDVDHEAFERRLGEGDKPPKVKFTASLDIFAARTGEPVLRIDGQAPYEMAWEADDTLLFLAYEGKEDLTTDKPRLAALVRCTTAGACELATEPKPSTAWTSPSAFAIRR